MVNEYISYGVTISILNLLKQFSAEALHQKIQILPKTDNEDLSTSSVESQLMRTNENPGDCTASQLSDIPGGSPRLNGTFYNKPCTQLAQSLLGKRVVRLVDGQRLSGRIVETEAYLGL